MASLENIALLDLVNEIRRRSTCSLVLCQLKESSTEADIEQFLQADIGGEAMQLLAMVDLAQVEIRRYCQEGAHG